MGKYEIYKNLEPMFNVGTEKFISWSIFPKNLSIQAYVELLLDTPEFFLVFWNSTKIVFITIFGQLIVSVPAAWGLSIYQYKIKNLILAIYIVLMMIPFMVIMIPQYLILNKFALLDSLWAIIVPGIFSTLPVFIIYTFFSKIPKTVIEAARVDGANELQIFLKIGIPLGYPGIVATILLSFIEYWNVIEQPLIFLRNQKLTTLTLYLPNISLDNIRVTLVASVITLVPSVILFVVGQSYLENGIASIVIKE
ncbi:carbohydrate ABC transporter permease [Carnobacterium divergens]|uniref:carbohydrate ABC transporter permease n=1 Tax=Carnobacterium divergens TaxID=2748 RepID=UPI001931148E|nr:carbohydrate ABC transporter permease [Carnobacterium divergens]